VAIYTLAISPIVDILETAALLAADQRETHHDTATAKCE
jgi:hypothetical protein